MDKKIFVCVIYSVIIILLGVSIYYMVCKISNERKTIIVNKKMSMPVKVPKFITKNIYKEEKNKKIDINIPYSNSKVFNEKIENIKNKYLNYLQVGKNTDTKLSLIISYDVSKYSDNIISFKINTNIYLGGAHPNAYIDTITFDFNKNKELYLEDVIENNLVEIADLCRENLLKEKILKEHYVDTIFKDGTKPVNKNFKRFLIEENCIILFFERYQIAPYVAGEFSVCLDKNKVKFNKKNL